MLRQAPLDLNYLSLKHHMAAYLASAYQVRRTWTICIPAKDLSGRPWTDVLHDTWAEVLKQAGEKNLRLTSEELNPVDTGRVVVLVSVRRVPPRLSVAVK